MLRGFYIASNGLINQERVLNTVSNNLANVKTAGYKNDLNVQNTFKRELILLNQGRDNTEGTFEYKFTEDAKTFLDQGGLTYSARPLDIAIDGPVYFNIETENGEVGLTKNGQFDLDTEGYLCLNGAGRVLGENGPIYVGTSDFSVNNDGEIFINQQRSDALALTYISPDGNVTKNGDNTFTVNEGETGAIPEGTKFSVIQGAYENSNVDAGVEMTRALEAQRAFESMSKVVTMLDKINESSVNSLGKF